MAVDPLQLLREYTMARRPVVLEGDHLVFGEVRLPRATETAFRSLKGQGPPYTLDACWFLLQHEDAKFPDYLVECSRRRFPKVSLVDKKDLLAYLSGRSTSAPLHLSSASLLAAPAALLGSSSATPAAASQSAETPHPTPSAGPNAAAAAAAAATLNKRRSLAEAQLTDATTPGASLQQRHSTVGEAHVSGKKARLEPQDIELDDRLKESKRLVARRLEQPKGIASSSSSSSSASEAIPYGVHGPACRCALKPRPTNSSCCAGRAYPRNRWKPFDSSAERRN